MAAARIDRLVHHCHIMTIRGNSYRLRHGSLARPARRKIRSRSRIGAGALVRSSRRTEAGPLADLSDFQPAEL